MDNDTSRPTATNDDKHTLTIEHVADLYSTAGHARTIRTLQRYCVSGHLDCLTKTQVEVITSVQRRRRDRVYPFCFQLSDGIEVAAPPSVRGKDVRTLKDPTGKAFGEELYKAGQSETISEVSYMFPKPGETTPSPKVSYVTKAGDLGCGVGYYK